jgi:hypothetical protein
MPIETDEDLVLLINSIVKLQMLVEDRINELFGCDHPLWQPLFTHLMSEISSADYASEVALQYLDNCTMIDYMLVIKE